MPKKRKTEGNETPSTAKIRLITEIKKMREDLGLSQREVASEIGIDPSTYNAIENVDEAKHTFPIENIISIARALKISPHKLLAIYTGEEPEKYTSKEKVAFEKIVNIIQDYLEPGNPVNLPPSQGLAPVHHTKLGNERFDAAEQIDAINENLNSQKPVDKHVENQES